MYDTLCGATRAPVSAGAAALSLGPATRGVGGRTRQTAARAQLHEATSGWSRTRTKQNTTIPCPPTPHETHTRRACPANTDIPPTPRHLLGAAPVFAKPCYTPVLPPLPPPPLFPSSAYTRRPAAGNNPPTAVPSAAHQAPVRPASLGRRRCGRRPPRRRVRRELLPQAADKVVVRRLVVPVVLPLTLGGTVGRGGSLNPACTSTTITGKKRRGGRGGVTREGATKSQSSTQIQQTGAQRLVTAPTAWRQAHTRWIGGHNHEYHRGRGRRYSSDLQAAGHKLVRQPDRTTAPPGLPGIPALPLRRGRAAAPPAFPSQTRAQQENVRSSSNSSKSSSSSSTSASSTAGAGASLTSAASGASLVSVAAPALAAADPLVPSPSAMVGKSSGKKVARGRGEGDGSHSWKEDTVRNTTATGGGPETDDAVTGMSGARTTARPHPQPQHTPYDRQRAPLSVE